MTQSQPPLPQPQLQPAGITFDQYVEFTPEKLELSNGYLGYGRQQEKELFKLWYQVRDGTLKRCEFQLKVQSIRNSIKSSLQEAANYEVGYKENTPFAKTVRTCRQILKVEPALWLFVDVEGVEPTNNAAERAIRPAVKLKLAEMSVSRMLTVVTSSPFNANK